MTPRFIGGGDLCWLTPPHLVGKYLDAFACETGKSLVYDPFSGTGTTLVESKKRGCASAGSEALDFCFLASQVKTTWDIPIDRLATTIDDTLSAVAKDYARYGFFTDDSDSLFPSANNRTLDACAIGLPDDQRKLIGAGYISERPLQKLLVFKSHLQQVKDTKIRNLLTLALGAVTLAASNVGFGPEIYARKPKLDSDVYLLLQQQLAMMLEDMRSVQSAANVASQMFLADARNIERLPLQGAVDAVITSPPYPNEKNYARITRLEHVVCDFVTDKHSLKTVKKRLLRSNSNNMYKEDDDDKLVKKFASIQNVANAIEERRIELGKDSGWERLYPSVTRNYFGGMYKHLSALKPLLKKGAKCAYVVGDQMSFLMVHIKTGELLAEIADDIGYKVKNIDLWRERWATASKTMLREEVLVLENK